MNFIAVKVLKDLATQGGTDVRNHVRNHVMKDCCSAAWSLSYTAIRMSNGRIGPWS